jgi:hypothetical protein
MHGEDITEAVAAEIEDHAERCGCRFFDEGTYREFRWGFKPNEIGFEGCKVFTACPD